jgi:hypothetical protein
VMARARKHSKASKQANKHPCWCHAMSSRLAE